MKKRVRIYKAGGNTGQYINKTAQFLQRADEGMEIRNEESDMNIHERILTFIQKSLQEGKLSRDEITKAIVDQDLGYEEKLVTNMIDDVTVALQQQMMQQQQQAMLAQQQPQMKSQQEVMPEEEMETDEMQENYSRLGGQKKLSRKKFIKDYLKKAQEGLQQVSSTNDIPLDGREAFKNNFIKGVQESVLKNQANEQFDLQNTPDMMSNDNLTTARKGKQVSRDMRKINRDFQKMFGNTAVGYANPGSMMPYGVSVINPLMNSAAFNVPQDKTTGNEKGEMIDLPNMKIRAKRGWLGRLKEWEADINFGALPANMMYGMQTGYPFQTSSYNQSFSPGVVSTRKVAKIINNESIKEVANATNSEAANNAAISSAEKARQDAEKAKQEKLAEQNKNWMYYGATQPGIQLKPNTAGETKRLVDYLNYLHQGKPFSETPIEGNENDPEGYYKYLKDYDENPYIKKSSIADDPNTSIREDFVYSGPISQNEFNAKTDILNKKYDEYDEMKEGPAKDKAYDDFEELDTQFGRPFDQESYITTDDEGNEYSTNGFYFYLTPNPKAKELFGDRHFGDANEDWMYNNRNLLFKQKGGVTSIPKFQNGNEKKGKVTANYPTSKDYQELLNYYTNKYNTLPTGTDEYYDAYDNAELYRDSLHNAELKESIPQQLEKQEQGNTAYQELKGAPLNYGVKDALSSYMDYTKMAQDLSGNKWDGSIPLTSKKEDIKDPYMFGNVLGMEDAALGVLKGLKGFNNKLNDINNYFGLSNLGFNSGGQISQQDSNYGNPDLYKFINGGIDLDGYPMVKDITDPYFQDGGLYKAENGYETYSKQIGDRLGMSLRDDLSAKEMYELAQKAGLSNSNFSQGDGMGGLNNRNGQGFQPGQYYPGMSGGYGRPNYGREMAGSLLGMPLGMLGARRNKLFTPDFNYYTQTGVPTIGGMPYYGQLDPTKISNIHTESKGRGLFRRPSSTMDINFNVPAGSTRPKLYTDASGNIKNANPMFSSNVGTTQKKEMSPMESVLQRETEGMSGKDLRVTKNRVKEAFRKGYGSDYMEDDSRNSTTYSQGTPLVSSNNISGYTSNASGPGNSGYNADSDGNSIPDYLEVTNESETPQSSVNWQQSSPNTDYLQQVRNSPFAGNPDLQRFTEEQAAPNQLNIQAGTPGFDLPASGQAPPAEFNISEGDAFEQRQMDKGLVWNDQQNKWVPNAQNMATINAATDPNYIANQRVAGNAMQQMFSNNKQNELPQQEGSQEGIPEISTNSGFDLPMNTPSPRTELSINNDTQYIDLPEEYKNLPNIEGTQNDLQMKLRNMRNSAYPEWASGRPMYQPGGEYNLDNLRNFFNGPLDQQMAEETPVNFADAYSNPDNFQELLPYDFTQEDVYFENDPIVDIPFADDVKKSKRNLKKKADKNSKNNKSVKSSQNTIQQKSINNSNSNYETPKPGGLVSPQLAAEQARIRDARKKNPEVANLDYQVVKLSSKVDNLRNQEYTLLNKKNKTAQENARLQQINAEANQLTIQLSNLQNQLRAKVNNKKLGGLAKFQGTLNSQVKSGFSQQTGMKCPMGSIKDPVTGFCKDVATGQIVQPISNLNVPSVDQMTKNPFTNTASNPYKNPLTGESAAITNTNDGYKYTGDDLVDMTLPDETATAKFKMNKAGTLNTYDLASNIFNLGMPMASNLLTTARNQRTENTYLGRQQGRTAQRDKMGQYSELTGRDALRANEEGEIIVGQNAMFGGSKYKQGGVYNMSERELMAFMQAGGQIEFL